MLTFQSTGEPVNKIPAAFLTEHWGRDGNGNGNDLAERPNSLNPRYGNGHHYVSLKRILDTLYVEYILLPSSHRSLYVSSVCTLNYDGRHIDGGADLENIS